MIVTLAAPAVAVAHTPALQRAAFAAPWPAPPLRDVVHAGPSAGGARIAMSASGERYSLNDGSDDSITVVVTAACQQQCDAADPQAIANAVGTFIHGPEVNLLTVQLETPFQLGFDCGFEAQACYFAGENRIVLSGNASSAPDGASREFVLAHEYGHHVAQHRSLPPPFSAAIDWGTERWASVENVCQGERGGAFSLGGEGRGYYQDPGEAFAESFAFNRFPDAAVRWAWAPALRPTPASLRALRRDTLRPWAGRASFVVAGRVAASGVFVREFRTPFDGRVSIAPIGRRRLDYRVLIRSPSGRPLGPSRRGVSARHGLDYTVCGQPSLRLAVRGRPGRRVALLVQRP